MIVCPCVRTDLCVVDDAMMNAVLDPLGDLEAEAEDHFTWEIHNYSKLPHRNVSPEYEIGGYKWSSLPCSRADGVGAFSSFHGEIVKKTVHPSTSKPSRLKAPLQTGTSARSSQSACGTPPTRKYTDNSPPATASTMENQIGGSPISSAFATRISDQITITKPLLRRVETIPISLCT